MRGRRAHPVCPAQVIEEAVPLGPIGLKATLPSPRGLTVLPNTYNEHRETTKTRQGDSKINMSQLKDKKKTPDKALNKIKSNLLDAESKTLVIKMLNKLRGRVNELSGNFN